MKFVDLARRLAAAVSNLAEQIVLAAVLAIAATASYIHLRGVWEYARAPIPLVGPLIVDGLFAAAWLRMRRRRRQGEPVGWLAWTALGVALAGTLAGNLAAAWIEGARDPLSLAVAITPAIAFALVWELATGHGASPRQAPPGGVAETGGPDETWEHKRDRLIAAGLGRMRLAKELRIKPSQARLLLRDAGRTVTADATTAGEPGETAGM